MEKLSCKRSLHLVKKNVRIFELPLTIYVVADDFIDAMEEDSVSGLTKAYYKLRDEYSEIGGELIGTLTFVFLRVLDDVGEVNASRNLKAGMELMA